MIALPGEFSGELPSPTHYPTPCPGQRLAVCHESFAALEQRLSRGVEQLATDRQQLPSQSFGAADRLQGIMDSLASVLLN